MRTYVCTAKGCCCGRPVEFRTIDGRRTPIHQRVDRSVASSPGVRRADVAID